MLFANPFKNLTTREWLLWSVSLLIVIVSNLLSQGADVLTLIAFCIGVISLVLAAKENPAYLSVAVNFAIFFFNNLYGFFRWKKEKSVWMDKTFFKCQDMLLPT